MIDQTIIELMLLDTTLPATSFDHAVAKENVTNATNISSLLHFTIPDGKLFYPEPFIASPSYLHSDITYLHIFQYWYWLWFMFIFLVCFFFISFVCTVRWCTNRVRPRRETRGVSRSKCGDLITACVPVSWAMSIIVNESTDATDLNDGFGTAELVVGVRAYQWGWEYYYPKSIDLNYNVRPSYSTFIGNSLKYNFTSGRSLTTNYLWRMYQNKPEDRVVTPAHLMLIPLDVGSSTNFLNFKSIGVNALSESTAFAKIRNSTKIYNSNLVHTPSQLISHYKNVNSLYLNETSQFTAASFGLKRQHSLASTSALGNTFASTSLDSASFNKFIKANLNLTYESPNPRQLISKSALSLEKEDTLLNESDANKTFTVLLKNSLQDPASTFLRLTSYPTALENINDNSDKSGVSYPATKLISPNLVKASLNNSNLYLQYSDSTLPSSPTTSFASTSHENASTTAKVFNLNGPNSKVLAGEQSIRHFPSIKLNKSNYNLSTKFNTVTSNLSAGSVINSIDSPYRSVISDATGYVDKSLVNKVLSGRSFTSDALPSVHSSLPESKSLLNYDSTTENSKYFSPTKNGSVRTFMRAKNSTVSQVLEGSREKTPRVINTAYWSTFWSSTNPSNRVQLALEANLKRTHFYLPVFYTYSDYDFRNDQAIDLLEEILWETSYSSYNFYDYMNLKSENSKSQIVPKKDFGLEQQFHNLSTGAELTAKSLTSIPTKDLHPSNQFYTNSIQMEDYVTTPGRLTLQNFVLFPIFNDLNELEDSFLSFKGLEMLTNKLGSNFVGQSTWSLAPRSYISVFNSFRSDLIDFTWFRNTADGNVHSNELFNDLNSDGTTYGSDLRISNPVSLRASVRNSVVNYNAFQKVFKPRLDEGRAHVNSSHFADLRQRQPFLSDVKIPYNQLLGKNRDSFFSTPLFTSSAHLNFNTASSLIESLNTPMFDFPFLLARTSDTTRFTWIDWFAKWKHIEVQPSSISRYSTLGVPYLRKAFDFNSTTGDKFQETELYFTRVARSRRNYLPNWSYSPFMYKRSYIWGGTQMRRLVYNSETNSADNLTGLITHSYINKNRGWKLNDWENINTAADVSYSSSGDTVYNKSTWRPTTSIQSYYYSTSKLVDILSKREFLYRRVLEKSQSNVYFPQNLCATPSNKILQELKSTFLFVDPANFSSEYSRDFLYSSNSYFKFLLLKNTLQSVSNCAYTLPINPSMLTKYTFFYFFGTDTNEIGRNFELYKNQFRPLKKGISNMLRLHATGAVAMPIEIRLQVLASSRDVIHSWAIPSASVKIDCVPGYTSHRTMKFLLTGVYWGQCQEICGRYHHWMPIVVYFMKRDLFFLWCTHFVFTKTPNSTWDIADRQFADFIRFASYDKSSWLNEFGLN